MEINNNVEKIVIIFFLILIISFFFIPELILIIKINQRLKSIYLDTKNCEKQKAEIKLKIIENKNISEKLNNEKEKEISKLKELAVINSLYGDSLKEEKSDNYINERMVDIMESLINLYENNYNETINIINNLKNFFKLNSLKDYINNKSNILMVSSIIKDELDIDFIYNKILPTFYLNSTKSNNYILYPPCFKASIDTNEPSIFHKKCNDVGDTIMLIKTNKTIFGGITEYSWSQKNVKIPTEFDTRTLLFNLKNKKIFKYNSKHNVSKYIAPISGDNYCFAIFGYKDIYLDYLPKDSYSNFPSQFLSNDISPNNYNELLDEKNHNKNKIVKFEYIDIEVYPIIKINNNQ